MKAALLVKFCLVLPVILLVDYLLMVALGCASCLFGLGDHYYCGSYCLIGKLILLASAFLFGYLVWRDVNRFRKEHQNGQAE